MTDDRLFPYTMTFTDHQIADVLKAIKRLDSNARNQLIAFIDALKKLEPGQRIMIARGDPEGDRLRLEVRRKEREAEREARSKEAR
jgi:hypothetical protein